MQGTIIQTQLQLQVSIIEATLVLDPYSGYILRNIYISLLPSLPCFWKAELLYM